MEKLKETMTSTVKEKKVSNKGIPDDAAFNILLKLSIKSLNRFMCVQKSWSNLLENTQFMRLYSQNFISKDDGSIPLLKQQAPDISNLFMLSGERFENMVKLDWPSPFLHKDDQIIILGSCVDGIIGLLRQRTSRAPFVVLWNPATDEFKVIPSGVPNFHAIDPSVMVPGFGYDRPNDDYKLIQQVVSFVDCYADCEYPIVPTPFWQIYSLKKNSWKTLHLDIPHSISYKVGFAVNLNGLLHWSGYVDHDEGTKEDLLVSFDMSNETFHTTLIGWHYNFEYYNVCRCFVAFNGSIGMISYFVDSSCFDISILGQVGVKESWTKLFTIEPLPFVKEPIGVGTKGDIFFIGNDDEIVHFDLCTQMTQKIGIKGKRNGSQIITYKESFLPIGGSVVKVGLDQSPQQ